jgi:hypothetical protein
MSKCESEMDRSLIAFASASILVLALLALALYAMMG